MFIKVYVVLLMYFLIFTAVEQASNTNRDPFLFVFNSKIWNLSFVQLYQNHWLHQVVEETS